jgi:hypothetical protein
MMINATHPWKRTGHPARELTRDGLDIATIYACRGALEARLRIVDGEGGDALWSWALHGTGERYAETRALGLARIAECIARWREETPAMRAALAREPIGTLALEVES